MDSNSKHMRIEESQAEITNLPKRQKIFVERQDRISSLPNRVLCHILSFLPTRYAVGTCILSTRWKYLWTSLPNLDFDDELLLRKEKLSKFSIREMRVSFASFVDRVLILHKGSNIQRFRLKCGRNCDYSNAHTWICSALRRNVQELDLCISMKDSKMLPCGLLTCGLFTCRTLVFLKLGTMFVLKVPTSLSLPRLKILHLNSIEFPDDDSIQKLVSGCPVLEELVIEECGLENIRLLNISAPALKHLTMECAFIGEYNTEFCEYKIVIDAPSLEFLRFMDYVAEGYLMKNLQSLKEAQIHIDLSRQKLEEKGYAYGKSVLELIKGITNVESLNLSGDCMEALTLCCHELPTFDNMTNLALDVNKHIGWKLLPCLLGSSPNLAALYFRQGFGGEYLWQNFPKWVPNCLLFRLKTIKLWAFKGQKDELKLLKYLLKNAKVLRKLIISSHLNKEEESEVSKTLLMFPRGSDKCGVVFS